MTPTMQLIIAVSTPTIAILTVLWRFNNNVVKSNIALLTVIEDVKKHDTKIENQGNKISEIVGRLNSKARMNERLEPLSYEGQ